MEITADHLDMVSEHLCYVHCNFCDTVLAVSVPSSSLFKTVAVRCGHCTNLFSVNCSAFLLPNSPSDPTLNHLHRLSPISLFSSPHSLLEEMNSASSLIINNHQPSHIFNDLPYMTPNNQSVHHHQEIAKPPPINRRGPSLLAKTELSGTFAPEKKQRVPSAYNRFIKEEIQRIKASNPHISHREAFSTAAKNWAHFPHIQFGLMPEQTIKAHNNVCYQQEGELNNCVITRKEGFLAATTNVNVGVGGFYLDET